MRIVFALAIGVGGILVGFATGWLSREHHVPQDGVLEDHALSTILGNLGQAHYLSAGDTKTAKALLDTSLHANLNRLREHDGAIADPAFIQAKVRTLNAVALYWQANPPFTSDEYRTTATNASWIEEWKHNQGKNLEILAWAQRECASHPEFLCKKP